MSRITSKTILEALSERLAKLHRINPDFATVTVSIYGSKDRGTISAVASAATGGHLSFDYAGDIDAAVQREIDRTSSKRWTKAQVARLRKESAEMLKQADELERKFSPAGGGPRKLGRSAGKAAPAGESKRKGGAK